MKASNKNTGHNRTIEFTDIPLRKKNNLIGGNMLSSITVTINYTNNSPGAVVDKAVLLDSFLIPEIIAAVNRRRKLLPKRK